MVSNFKYETGDFMGSVGKFRPGDIVFLTDGYGESHVALIKREHGLIECVGGEDCEEGHMFLAATWPVKSIGADLDYGEVVHPINNWDDIVLMERAV